LEFEIDFIFRQGNAAYRAEKLSLCHSERSLRGEESLFSAVPQMAHHQASFSR
jgi:hypothetical protein